MCELMVLPCDSDLRTTISAVKIAVAVDLVNKLGMSRNEVASKLGITGAAMTKYTNSNYSKDVARVVEYLKKRGLQSKLVKEIAFGRITRVKVLDRVDSIASRPDVISASRKKSADNRSVRPLL